MTLTALGAGVRHITDIQVYPDTTGYAPPSERYHAVDASTYCGCHECQCPVGVGATPDEAIADLLELMEDE